jgi:hypothetical protein
LIVFFIALLTIPCLIYFELFLLAKIIGISITITLVVMLRIWLHQLKKQKPSERYAFTTNDVFELHSLIPAFKQLSAADQQALQHRLGLIMRSLLIHNPDDLPIPWTPKTLAISGACFAFMQFDQPNEVVWIIQKNAQLSVDGKYLYLGTQELEVFLRNLTSEELESRLSA